MQMVCPCEEQSWLFPFSCGQQSGVGVESVTTAGWQESTGLSSSLGEKCINNEKQTELEIIFESTKKKKKKEFIPWLDGFCSLCLTLWLSVGWQSQAGLSKAAVSTA